MPTAADRGVDLKAAGSRREHRHDLLRQHRQVPFLHLSSTTGRRIPSGSWKRMWCVGARSRGPARAWASDSGSSRALAVVVPAGRGPDLGVVARADDDGLGVEAGHLAQVGRDEDAALAVERRLDGAGEDEPLRSDARPRR